MGKIFLKNVVYKVDTVDFEIEGSVKDLEDLIQHLRFTDGVKDLSKNPEISTEGGTIKVITLKEKYSVITEELIKYHSLCLIKIVKTFEK